MDARAFLAVFAWLATSASITCAAIVDVAGMDNILLVLDDARHLMQADASDASVASSGGVPTSREGLSEAECQEWAAAYLLPGYDWAAQSTSLPSEARRILEASEDSVPSLQDSIHQSPGAFEKVFRQLQLSDYLAFWVLIPIWELLPESGFSDSLGAVVELGTTMMNAHTEPDERGITYPTPFWLPPSPDAVLRGLPQDDD